MLQDNEIVDLFWAREGTAIAESDKKYGKMLYGISFSVLSLREDAEECVNDTYFAAWNRMPEERPMYLGAFLSRIVRHLSVDKYRKNTAEKRGGGEVCAELEDCIPSNDDVFSEIENKALAEAIDIFLSGLSQEKRMIFVRRYFYNDSLEDISKRFRISVPKIKSVLHRIRLSLKKELEDTLL